MLQLCNVGFSFTSLILWYNEEEMWDMLDISHVGIGYPNYGNEEVKGV